MKKTIKIILTIISVLTGARSYSSEIPVYTGPEKTYMPVSENSNINGKEDGMLICWFEESNNGSIRIQKLDNYGRKMWVKDGVLFETGTGSEFSEETDYPYLFSDNEGGAIMIFRKKFYDREDIMIKRIFNNGVIWNSSVRISSAENSYNFSPSAVRTSDGRIAVVWESFSGGDFNIHGQLIDLHGNKIWNNGEPLFICIANDDQRRPAVTCDANNKLFISWLDSRKHSEYIFDVYGEILDVDFPDIKINHGGNLIFRNVLNDNKRKLTMYDLNAVPIDKSSFIIAFEHSYDQQFSDLKIIKVNNEIENEWEITIDSDSDQKNPHIIGIDNGRTAIFWNDIGNDHNEIYGLVAGKDGNILWGDINGSRISFESGHNFLGKVLPYSRNHKGSFYMNENIYLPWVSGDLNKLYLTSIHLSDGSLLCKCSEHLQEKISEGEYTSISANKNGLFILYKQADHIYASFKDISKQGIPNTADIPAVYNYPNPFNPATRISFNIPADGFVRLSVYDVTGKLINVLINEFRTKGNYEAGFNGSNLSSGMYYYRLETNGKNIVRKMTLIK